MSDVATCVESCVCVLERKLNDRRTACVIEECSKEMIHIRNRERDGKHGSSSDQILLSVLLRCSQILDSFDEGKDCECEKGQVGSVCV